MIKRKIDKKDLEIIKNECFWDYNINIEDIEKIFINGSNIEKKKLVEKIILNTKDKIKYLYYFDKNDLRKIFDSIKLNFNSKYIKKHLLALEYLLFGKKVDIKGLRWKK